MDGIALRRHFRRRTASDNPASLGLNTANANFTSLDYGLPVNQSSVSFAGLGANKSNPRGRVDSNLQYLNNFSYNHGSHNWKFGFEFRRTSVNQYFDLSRRGKLVFNTLDDFLAGNITGGGNQTEGNSRRHTYQDSFAFYLQDNFRVSHKLTVNYGVRWDYFGVIGEKNHLFSILNPSMQPRAGWNRRRAQQPLPKGLQQFLAARRRRIRRIRHRENRRARRLRIRL